VNLYEEKEKYRRKSTKFVLWFNPPLTAQKHLLTLRGQFAAKCGGQLHRNVQINHSIDEKVFAYLMPNPVIDYLYLNTNITTGDLIIHNIGGRLLDKFKVRRGQNTINLSNYPSGVYIFTLINQYEHISLGKIVKGNE
jgi:hypothetical protein